jgi:hypothetical protein
LKTKIIFFATALLFVLYYRSWKHNEKRAPSSVKLAKNDSRPLSEQPLVALKSDCNKLKKSYLHLDELRTKSKLDLRFENTHKEVGGKVYRLRHFYKDGPEGEIETYLVYQEDQNENAKIIEKSSYKKGNLYSKIELNKGKILYHEEGVDLPQNGSDVLFLHYINNQLMGMQGTVNSQNEAENIDCRYQQE